MAVRVSSSGPRGAKTYEIRWKDGELYDYTDNAYDAKQIAARARKEERDMRARYTRKNSGKSQKRPTKLQRLLASTKRAKAKRMSVALAKFLKQANPAAKYSGATVRRNKGGSITIVPIKVRRVK